MFVINLKIFWCSLQKLQPLKNTPKYLCWISTMKCKSWKSYLKVLRPRKANITEIDHNPFPSDNSKKVSGKYIEIFNRLDPKLSVKRRNEPGSSINLCQMPENAAVQFQRVQFHRISSYRSQSARPRGEDLNWYSFFLLLPNYQNSHDWRPSNVGAARSASRI